MKRYYASENLRKADRLAEETYAIPGVVLMENAGRGAAEAILRHYPYAGKILILCGPGNNGGDGFVLARQLSIAGRSAQILSTLTPDSYKSDAATAVNAAVRCGLQILETHSLGDGEISKMVRDADLVVDALLGTGSTGAPRGEIARLISHCPLATEIVSLDIPSGVDPDSGETAGPAVKASLTATFLAEKPGLAIAPGALHAGKIELCHIGISTDRVLADEPLLLGYDRSDIPALAPSVPKDAHKGDRGSLLIVGGCENYRGAPVLAAMGALRAGCGLVALAIPDFLVSAASSLLPEAIFEPLPTKSADTQEERIVSLTERYDAAVLGPGIGRGELAAKITDLFWRRWQKPLLVDADALYHLSRLAGDEGFKRREDAIITPHAGEAARLLNKERSFVANRRLAACRELAARFSIALLKGSGTLISDSREERIVLEGSQALAVAGSGDVLSGTIGAFLAIGMPPLGAATLGALLHGRVGTDAQNAKRTLLAREIADRIRVEEQ